MNPVKPANGIGKTNGEGSGTATVEGRHEEDVDLVEIAMKGSADDLLDQAQSLREKSSLAKAHGARRMCT